MVLLAGILLTGCGSGGGNSKKNASNSTGFLIYGIASKGPIKVGFVTVHALDTTGTPGGLLGTTITADDGSYAVDIGTYTEGWPSLRCPRWSKKGMLPAFRTRWQR